MKSKKGAATENSKELSALKRENVQLKRNQQIMDRDIRKLKKQLKLFQDRVRNSEHDNRRLTNDLNRIREEIKRFQGFFR
jgi:predicted RNase H-like nuclease (RuvC/YqgF family)